METRVMMRREQEEEASQSSHSMKLSSHSRKKTFASSDEEPSYADFYPIIPGDIMSAKEILNIESTPCHKTWYVPTPHLTAVPMTPTREKWTMFGNEAEKVEVAVLRNQRALRSRVDRVALRTQAEEKAAYNLRYLELLSQRAPDFSIPLRAHCVWEGMSVTLACTLQGCPPPHVTWYKDGVELSVGSAQPWNRRLRQEFGLHTLEIRRCSAEDAGEYRVVARSVLGEASTFCTLLVNSESPPAGGLVQPQNIQHKQNDANRITERWLVLPLEQEASFSSLFPPTWVKEGQELRLSCSFTSPLLPFQTPPAWFRDGVRLCPSGRVEVMSSSMSTVVVIKHVHKEHEGVYTLRLNTRDGPQEHSAFVYVKDASAVVPGGPASPLGVQGSDVNLDYLFLSWAPPSADGASPVQGYYVERCDVAVGKWERCNASLQKACYFPVSGLRGGTSYRFRVCAVNQAGAGRWSKPTAPILTSDPLEPSRTMVVQADRGRQIIITKDELEGEVKVPHPPTQVTSSQVSNTYLVLSWSEPDPRGREPLTYYVERSVGDRDRWEMASLGTVVSSPRYPVLDLQQGAQYRFRMRSVNKYGVSEPSDPSELLSLGPPPEVPAPPHSVLVFRDSDSSVVLHWQAPPGDQEVLGYYLYYSLSGSKQWNTINNKPISNTQFTAHGLQTQKEYVFRVKSVGRAGNSVYSNESTTIRVKAAIRAPSPPSSISLLMCSGSGMVLSWRAPACDGGSAVRGYYLDQRETDQGPWREVNRKAVEKRLYEVCNLTSGCSYQFRVLAANLVGLGGPSGPSQAFLCEEWTMAEPGCPYDLEPREVRSDSLLLRWEPPLYLGASPLIGYQLHVSQDDQSESWTVLNDELITDTFYKASGLKTGQTYRFRVSAVNQAGVGGASLPTELITAQTQPGTSEVEAGVDQDGFVFLSYEVPDAAPSDSSRFLWSRNHRQAVDAGRATVQDRDNRSVLTFREASKEDLGLYSVELSDQPSLSSSYNLTDADLERLTELSWQIRNPLVGLRSGWQVEVREDGGVRLWLQTEPLSADAELRLILNDREITSTSRRQVRLDRASGVVEVLLDPLEGEDQGSYTAQLRDGRARNQFTLLLVDHMFHQTLSQSRANRRNIQKKTGPYFLEYLSWEVTEECELVIRCKVTNLNKDSSLKWFKDGAPLTPTVYDPSSGVSTLSIPQVTQAAAGSYRAQVADRRGEDISTLDLLDEEFDKLLQQLSKQCALSAGPVQVQGMIDGLRLYCSLKFYHTHLKTTWTFRERRLEQDPRARPGSSMDTVWVDVSNPADTDRGNYTLELFDGQDTHTRHLDLSGQERAKVTKGLPDAVAIMEGKSLCLTCFIDGDPSPTACWLRNGQELSDRPPFSIARQTASSAITISNVSTEDSGKYSIQVRNQYGGETVNVTVSVYRMGEQPPAHTVMMG
ncbi:Myomesin-3 [Merluccius polli]|uniref:Myomesin-3 n=1 Tax=Merluccius polli TaxID=89951 RepID=A0AA47NXX6_MERPO|nr:Myomesin-3 [Merluccius polli]